MNNKLRNIICAGILAAGALSLTWMYVEKCEELSFVQAERTSLKQDIQILEEIKIENEKELKSRDTILEEYRRKMDSQDAEIERLQKIEKAHKECPTREKLAKKERVVMSVRRGSSTRGTPIQMTLTFYGDSAAENGGYAGMDAQGGKLRVGTVASNVYPFGTQFSWNGQTYTVRDRGGSHFNSPNRLDVFVPRNSGESESAYNARIRQYGKRTVTVYKQ